MAQRKPERGAAKPASTHRPGPASPGARPSPYPQSPPKDPGKDRVNPQDPGPLS